MVPREGLEPPRPKGQQILSLPRLPIPPQGLALTGAEKDGHHRGAPQAVNPRPASPGAAPRLLLLAPEIAVARERAAC